MKINALTGALLLAGALTGLLTSCGGDDDKPAPDRGEVVATVTFPAGLTYVSPQGNSAKGYISKTTGYAATMYQNLTADLNLAGGINAKITDVPYKNATNGTIEADGTNIKSSGDYTGFKEVEFEYGPVNPAIPAVDTDNGFTIHCSLTASDNTELLFIPSQVVCCGTTVVTSASTEPFSSTATTYLITLKSAAKAKVTVRNARFAQSMPAVGDMVFDDIDIVRFDDDGYYLASASLVPSIMGVPYPSFAITDFSAYIDIDDYDDADSNISFACGALGRAYQVKASKLGYYSAIISERN